jgi:hypothetical protein
MRRPRTIVVALGDRWGAEGAQRFEDPAVGALVNEKRARVLTDDHAPTEYLAATDFVREGTVEY